ncbi:hypothetical protein [Homoserinibacter gongjuensis]|uniref:hypothetical protein n=1 Tax=Homoserinibacter gongjuensis TaxID=1162968 RepID=UPI0024E14AB1|nr:hypothetical protein [Homoserinibacter gongjuensis]
MTPGVPSSPSSAAPPLLHFVDAPTTRIELSTTHPGGLARFITGKSTLLSQLIRDDLALRRARVAAERITAKGLELSTTRGLDVVHLGIGIVRWTHDRVDYCAPLLLRPSPSAATDATTSCACAAPPCSTRRSRARSRSSTASRSTPPPSWRSPTTTAPSSRTP